MRARQRRRIREQCGSEQVQRRGLALRFHQYLAGEILYCAA